MSDCDGTGNIVRSIDKYALKEYNYVYEGGKVTHSTEYSVSLNGNEIVTEKILLNTVRYFYTKEEQLERKLIEDCDGNFFEYRYEYPENGEPIVCCKVNGQIIRAQSESDHLGRKVFDELQLGKANLFRKFSYTDGAATQKHLDEGAVLSKPTTALISKMEFADGRTIEYEYDGEERITKVIDSFDGITEYEYDTLGQLKTETVNGTVVNNMTYDNYGNITEKNGVVYQYGNAVWKDLLTQVGTGANSTITYDANGNPTTYLGHTLTWEKGRQLKKFDNIEYTYNANGIRTSKKVNGVLHTYTLDGTKILRETWGENTLVPLYDNEDSICGILYNSVSYYFVKNLQGDVIAITNANGVTVAQYTYDAWGVPTIKEDTSGCNIATVNPFRYRGYYYDAETKLYYLQSRYYDPNIGRFINEDTTPQISFVTSDALTSNMYSYCSNSPSNMCDESGFYGITFKIISSIVSAFSGAYIGAAVATYFGLKGWKKVLCMVGGAALMGLVGWVFPLANLYAAVKGILYAAGCAYLSIKGYSIALMTYSHGMWGAGYPLSSNEKQKFINKIKGCQEYKDMKSILVKRYENGEKSPEDTVEFVKDADLHYAVQHMSMTLTYDSKNKKYKIEMEDTYDFDEWRKIFSKAGISFANTANNLGLLMQKCGMMIPYKISLQFDD